jgi:hypothetical protein
MSSRKTCAHILGSCSGCNTTAIVRHQKDGSTRIGTFAPHPEGKPIPPNSEYVHLQQDSDGDWTCETLYAPGDDLRGPAKVSTDAYRSGWDTIWGKPNRTLN